LAGSAALVDIATAAGFADQSHMTRELRRLLGISPAAYRRALRSP
jgi:AraC-like DNA-binding protein